MDMMTVFGLVSPGLATAAGQAAEERLRWIAGRARHEAEVVLSRAREVGRTREIGWESHAADLFREGIGRQMRAAVGAENALREAANVLEAAGAQVRQRLEDVGREMATAQQHLEEAMGDAEQRLREEVRGAAGAAAGQAAPDQAAAGQGAPGQESVLHDAGVRWARQTAELVGADPLFQGVSVALRAVGVHS